MSCFMVFLAVRRRMVTVLDKGFKGLHIVIYPVLQYLVFKSAVTDSRGEREKNESVIKKKEKHTGRELLLELF